MGQNAKNYLIALNNLAKSTGKSVFNAGAEDGIWGKNTDKAYIAATKEGYVYKNGKFIKEKSKAPSKEDKNWWNSFLEWIGIKDQNPTLDEFYRQKAQEKAKEAATTYRETYAPSIPLGHAQKGHSTDYSKMSDEEVSKMFTKWRDALKKLMDENPNLDTNAKKLDTKTLALFNDAITHPKKYKTSIGFNCLTSIMSAYGIDGPQMNLDFKNNVSKYGFLILEYNPDDILEGDIHLISRDGTPIHSYMITRTPSGLFSSIFGSYETANAGGDPGEGYTLPNGDVTHGKTLKTRNSQIFKRDMRGERGDTKDSKGNNMITIRYVGTPSDSILWKSEYEKLYGLRFGGKLHLIKK